MATARRGGGGGGPGRAGQRVPSGGGPGAGRTRLFRRPREAAGAVSVAAVQNRGNCCFHLAHPGALLIPVFH